MYENIEYIREDAAKYLELSEGDRELMRPYAYPGMSADYYRGAYDSAYRMCGIADAESREVLMKIIYAIAHTLIATIEEEKKNVANIITDFANQLSRVSADTVGNKSRRPARRSQSQRPPRRSQGSSRRTSPHVLARVHRQLQLQAYDFVHTCASADVPIDVPADNVRASTDESLM